MVAAARASMPPQQPRPALPICAKVGEMPELIKLVLRNAAIGFVLAAVFVGVLIWTDTGGIGTLIRQSDSGPIALFMLTFFTGLTFGSAQISYAVMSAGQPDDEAGGHRRRVPPNGEAATVRIPVKAISRP
jgi:hypothetical protein